MRLRIYRYDPDKDARPYMKDYDVPLEPSDRMLLDALVKVKAQDDSFAFRRSCREGVCGSDAMNINGKNGLACITKLAELKEPVVLKPLPGLPVIRDLFVDMTQFFKQYHSIKPYLINNDPPPEKERLQSPEEREELDGLYECILCACCSTSCPSFWWNPDKFVGPAGLLQAYRFIADTPRPGDQRAARQSRGSVPALPLPLDHELRRRLPEGAQPDEGDRQDQGSDGPAHRVGRACRSARPSSTACAGAAGAACWRTTSCWRGSSSGTARRSTGSGWRRSTSCSRCPIRNCGRW